MNLKPETLKRIDEVITHYPVKRSAVLMLLHAIQEDVGYIPEGAIPREAEIGLDPAVLFFSLGLAIFTAVLFGLTPALQLTRRSIVDPLKDSGRGVTGGFRKARLRNALVVVELALSLVLLTGAGLMIRTFAKLQSVDLGFDPDFIDEPGDGDGDLGALVVDIGDEGDAVAAGIELCLDLAEAVSVGEGGGGDAHQLAAGFIHGDDLGDAGVDVLGFFGDHRLDEDGGVAADHGVAGAHGARPAAWGYQVHLFPLRLSLPLLRRA